VDVKEKAVSTSESAGASARFLLVADTEESNASRLLRDLDAEATVAQVRTLADVLRVGRENWSLVLMEHDCFGDSAVHLPAQFPDTPVVALGSASDEATMQRFLDWGFCGYLPSSYPNDLKLQVLRLVRGGTRYRPHQENPPHPAAPPIAEPGTKKSLIDYGLTPRQAEVLSLATLGRTNLEIARKLGIAEGTVKLHMRDVYRALEVENRSEAIVVAMRMEKVSLQQMRSAETGQLEVSWLIPHMAHLHMGQGELLFHKDDRSDAAYYLGRGKIELVEIGVQLGAGDFFGEIGIFSPGQKRSCSAKCVTDVELFRLEADKVRRMYFLNPQFALYVVHLIAGRLRADQERLSR
jgi:two-component system, NarL family, nitrate/nitrite response regulator NarL